MSYLWNSSLETGHKEIDEQHRQLFDALNNIAAAFKRGNGYEELYKTLVFLTDYTVMHFNTEEELMKKHVYDDYYAHKQCHEDFKKTVTALIRRLKNEGPSEDLVVTVTAVIGDWLISHIRVDDKRMTAFLGSKEH